MGIFQTKISKISLKEIIANSSLQDDQKQVWYNFIHQVTDQEIISILQTLEDDINNLDFLTKNLQDKIQAIKTQDKSALDKILTEEKEYLEKIEE